MAQQEDSIRIIITDNRLVSDHIEYKVEAHRDGARLSSISRRFREFTELHSQMSKWLRRVPNLPPKRFFGRTNPGFVQKRQLELQQFLDSLLKIMLQGPKAEAAWRLLCLFLKVDPKQFIPDSVGLRGANTGREAEHGNGIGVDGGYAGQGGSGGTPGGNESGQRALRPEEIEAKRLAAVVTEFSKRAINISRGYDDRLRKPPASMFSATTAAELEKSVQAHILNAPLFTGSAADGNGDNVKADSDIGEGETGKEAGSSTGEDDSEAAAEFELKFDPATLLHHLNSPEGKA